jgi:hypothetical protein
VDAAKTAKVNAAGLQAEVRSRVPYCVPDRIASNTCMHD